MLNRFSDLRFIIGAFFFVVGIILIIASLVGPSDIVEGVGVKANLIVGTFMTVFALFMFYLGYKGTAK